MDPLLWATYLASAALGPASIAWLTTAAVINPVEERTFNPYTAFKVGIITGLLSAPVMRHYSAISRDLESCVLKKPKVKKFPDGKLRVVPYAEARRDALEASVPVWFCYSFPCLSIAIATENENHRVVLSMLGTTFARLAAACRLQNVYTIKDTEYDGQELQPPRGGKPLQPMIYFNKAGDSGVTKLDEYSEEVKRIMENRNNKKIAPPSGGAGVGSRFFSWLKKPQRKRPEHNDVRMLLAGMK